MAKISIDLPTVFSFTTDISVRITDLNYGGHVGNDTILTLVHEGRMRFLKHSGYTEMDFGGTGMIMKDVAIVFKNELFYGDTIRMSIAVTTMSGASFDLVYRLQKDLDGQMVDVALAKTGMVCYDYNKKKVVAIPDAVNKQWKSIDTGTKQQL